MKKDSAFRKWFKAQFGGLPLTFNQVRRLADREHGLVMKMDVVREQLDNHTALAEKYTAALYAWQASPEAKRDAGPPPAVTKEEET